MKYIDADLLRAVIKEHTLFYAGQANLLDGTNTLDGYDEVLAIIDSLQQEQPDEPVSDCHDLEKEIKEQIYARFYDLDGMKLEEGIYEIPDDCTAVYSKRKVIVKKRMDADKLNVMRCSDCIHQKWGRLTMRNQWRDSPYCDKKPKTIAGKDGYFYNASSSKKACEMFEKKGS